MSDNPQFLLILPRLGDVLMRFDGFSYTVALLPDGLDLSSLSTSPHVVGTFLVEPDSVGEVLNGRALSTYLDHRVPVLIHARRERDLRPILRRATTFAARGYRIEVLAGEMPR